MNSQMFPHSSNSDKQNTPPPPVVQGVAKSSSDYITPPPSGRFASIERAFYGIFAQKLPQIPTVGRDLIAQYLPWVTLIMCMVMFPLILTAIINGGIIGIITSINEINKNPAYWVTLVLFLIQFVLMCIGTWHLLAHHRRGWKLLFVALLIGLIYTVAQAFSGFTNPLVSTPLLLLIGSISFYILYQARGYYTD
ncbi:MAG: hypothetical protein WAW60_03435 [Candidatus Saccharimonadales bacterium]